MTEESTTCSSRMSWFVDVITHDFSLAHAVERGPLAA